MGFNSCPRAEGNYCDECYKQKVGSFNSCPRAEGNRRSAPLWFGKMVSIRALARRATPVFILQGVPVRFQFVPSRGGQRNFSRSSTITSKFQFVPSRGGQRLAVRSLCRAKQVSIRALARRATIVAVAFCLGFGVSIRALARRATQIILYLISSQVVSIRALARRATFAKKYLKKIKKVSIRALARRATCWNGNSDYYGSFNSCPRAEGNDEAHGYCGNQKGFNSCPRAEGNAGPAGDTKQPGTVSIRALARRATFCIFFT